MSTSHVFERITWIALFVALPLCPPCFADEGADPDCPPGLVAWRIHGSAEAGAEWSAQLLEIRGDVAILRELAIRFDDGALPPEEARWFDAPSVLEPTGFYTRTLSFTDEELRPFCRSLSGPRFVALREETRPRCFVREDGAHVRMHSNVKITDPDPQASRRSGRGSLGITMNDGTDPDDAPCVSQEEFAARMEEIATNRKSTETDEPNDVVIDAIREVIDGMARREAPLETGLMALPPARHVLALLRRHDEERVPQNLPSEFYLTAVAASASYVEALALERMLSAEDSDEEVALKLLGDGATPAAVQLLRLKLRSASAANRPSVVGLTLRALLAADRQTARLEAVPLLANPAFARSALGIFALTDASIREELDALDTADEKAVAEAALRLLDQLEATTGDDDLREAVREARGGAAEGSAKGDIPL